LSVKNNEKMKSIVDKIKQEFKGGGKKIYSFFSDQNCEETKRIVLKYFQS